MLAERGLGDDRLQEPDGLPGPAGREQGFGVQLLRGLELRAQPGDFGLDERPRGQVRVRLTTPAGQRCLEGPAGLIGMSLGQRLAGGSEVVREPGRVQSVGRHIQPVSGGPGHQHLRRRTRGPTGFQDAPEVGDVGLQ